MFIYIYYIYIRYKIPLENENNMIKKVYPCIEIMDQFSSLAFRTPCNEYTFNFNFD